MKWLLLMILVHKKNIRSWWQKTSGSFIIVLALFTSCQSAQNTFQKNEGSVFATYYSIVYQSETDYHEEIKHLFTIFNSSLSTYDPSSVISRINSQEKGVKADSFFINVFEKAQEFTEITGGAFDMSVAPLVNVWGFGFEKEENVKPELIDSLKELTGMQYVSIKDGTVVKEKPGLMLDASGIAKGYGVDVVADFLRKEGVINFMVEIGGEIAVEGVNSKGQQWRIGIDKPIFDTLVLDRETALIVTLSGKALATSGNYRNFYIKDGIRYSHIIDPRSGYPVQNNMLSATLIAPDCITADAFATACMVLGADESLQLINQHAYLEACFIVDDGNDNVDILYSSNFHQYIK